MAYTKNPTWVDGEAGGTRIDAADLNAIEDGIYNAAATADAAYGPGLWPRISGRYYTALGVTSQNADANVFGTSGQVVFLSPFPIGPGGLTINQLRQYVATSTANGLLWMGVYGPSTAAGGLGTVSRLVQASTDASTIGDKMLTVSTTLPAGMCWLACGTTDTSGLLRVLRGNFDTPLFPLVGRPDASLGTAGALKFTAQDFSSGLPASINLSSFNAAGQSDQAICYVRAA